jgi:hypothetical protein
MTFQSYMKPPLEKHNAAKWEPLRRIPSKQERQEAFIRYCEEGGLTAYASLRLASVYPEVPADKIKILHCPKF